MRISDWSSDVCSSDLAAVESHEIGRDLVRRQNRHTRQLLAQQGQERIVPPASLGEHGLEDVEVSRGEAATMVMAHGCTPAGAALKPAAGSGCCSVAGTLLWSGARAGTRHHPVSAASSSAAASCSHASNFGMA